MNYFFPLPQIESPVLSQTKRKRKCQFSEGKRYFQVDVLFQVQVFSSGLDFSWASVGKEDRSFTRPSPLPASGLSQREATFSGFLSQWLAFVLWPGCVPNKTALHALVPFNSNLTSVHCLPDMHRAWALEAPIFVKHCRLGFASKFLVWSVKMNSLCFVFFLFFFRWCTALQIPSECCATTKILWIRKTAPFDQKEACLQKFRLMTN